MLMCKCYDGNFTDFIHEPLSYLQNSPDSQKQINRSKSHRVYLSKENLTECLNIEKENQRVKVRLARVKCQRQRNTRMSAILSVFPKPRESVSLKKSCYVAGSITSQSFSDFLNLSESCQKKAVFVKRHNTSFHSKFRQTALKLTPKGLDNVQIDTLRESCITDL